MTAQISIDLEQIADFCRRYEVQELALFGSVLREDFGRESDVDLLVTFAPDARVSLFDLVDMTDDLARILGRQVDLVPAKGLKPRIRRSVLESSQVIYAAA